MKRRKKEEDCLTSNHKRSKRPQHDVCDRVDGNGFARDYVGHVADFGFDNRL